VTGPGEAGRMRFVSRAYARLWSGQAASSLGDAVFTVSAVLWVDRDLAAGRPWAAAAVSGVTAAAYAAVAVAGPAAGVVVDRFDRRTVMAVTELARAGLAGGLAALAFAPAGLIPPVAWLAVLYAVVFALNAAGQFYGPARMAVIAALVPGDADRARAAGLAEAAAAGASTVGPLIAAPLMIAAGIRAALVVNAVSYLASWASVRTLPPSRPAPDGRRPGFLAGVRAFAASRYLTRLLSVTLLCQAGAGALTALNVLAVTCDLHGGARTYGAAEALMGAGYVAGSAAAGRLVRAAGPRAVTCGGLFAAAALTAGYALARDPATGLPLLAAYAAAIGVLNTSVAPYLMSAVPDGYLGRALALWGPANQAAGAVSVLASGWLASSALRGFSAAGLGPVSLLLLIGAGLITAAGIRAAAALPRGPLTGPDAPALSLPPENRRQPLSCTRITARSGIWSSGAPGFAV
jgi:MFS family permease